MTGKMIAKGPKVGQLFPLHISPSLTQPSSRLLSFACNAFSLDNKLWHSRLGHLNTDVLRTLFNSGLLGNKASSSLNISFVQHAKLVKVKVYIFPLVCLVPHNVLILFIVMFKGFLLFFMLVISILLR